jgi:hypothetical protein
MFIDDKTLFLSKWQLIDILLEVRSYQFLFGNPAGLSRTLKRIHDDKPILKERPNVIHDLKQVVPGDYDDYDLVPHETGFFLGNFFLSN